MLNRKECEELFGAMHPHFFERESIRNMQPEWICEEMLLELAGFSPNDVKIPVPDGITFGFFHGDPDSLCKSVAEVDDGWVKYYNSPEHAYCAFDGDRVVSFCDVDEMGVYTVGGRTLKIGGPGCVGTVPDYRRRGIGLRMVQDVTELLRLRGFDYSYIHWTAVGPWYAKLGYRTVLRWNARGLLAD